VVRTRNDLAHGRQAKKGSDVIDALTIAERILDAIVDRDVTDGRE
jgi:hypothetical protein